MDLQYRPKVLRVVRGAQLLVQLEVHDYIRLCDTAKINSPRRGVMLGSSAQLLQSQGATRLPRRQVGLPGESLTPPQLKTSAEQSGRLSEGRENHGKE
ncbi:hypothetical protein COCON_G00192810 [Conger conger]|uniref:Uncharacterized protein n=1 Tax=Conger conger TaxID=82655 RepID=A0A9Q1D4G5_CONCO|nr:hypothetical protein COCON_G00192810 [Conger conger]